MRHGSFMIDRTYPKVAFSTLVLEMANFALLKMLGPSCEFLG
jgi:hypothetical protein